MSKKINEPRFILHQPNSLDPTYIYLLISLPEGRLKFPINEKINPREWDPIAQRAILSDKAVLKKNKGINTTIQQITDIINKLSIETRLSGRPFSRQILKDILTQYLGREVQEGSKIDSFFLQINGYIHKCTTGELLTKAGKRFSPNTLKGYRHTRDNLQKYEKARKITLQFESLTIDRINDIVKFFNEQDHAVNSIGKTIKNLKVFLKAANYSDLAKVIRTPEELTPDIYLPDSDLQKLIDLKLDNKRYDLVRDRFILDCYLGLRVSDMKLLSNENVTKDYFIIANEKTDEKVVIPIHPRAKKILKKYKGIPPAVTDQEMNRIIKEVAFKAQLRDKFLYTITKGGSRKDFYYQKWQMVSNHTARRTFITNLLKAGVDSLVVMKLAGIKKTQTLERYNKMSAEENAAIAAKHSFFR